MGYYSRLDLAIREAHRLGEPVAVDVEMQRDPFRDPALRREYERWCDEQADRLEMERSWEGGR